MKNRRVLAVGAHPDDVEIMCSGTLLALGAVGCEIHIATLTLGDCGSMSLPPREIRCVRRAEAERACALIGAHYQALGFSDFCIYNGELANRRVTACLREVDPAVVITHPPRERRRATTRLRVCWCATPVFYAPAPNYDTSVLTQAPSTTAIPFLYYAHPMEGIDIYGREVEPQFYIDIGDVFERKLEMLSQHASQRDWLRSHHGIDEYLEAVRRWNGLLARHAAHLTGRPCRQAEAFVQHCGHAYPRENVLSELLRERVIDRTADPSGAS